MTTMKTKKTEKLVTRADAVEELSKWLQTPDDWAPTFPEPQVPTPEEYRRRWPNGFPRNKPGFVRCTLRKLTTGAWRVCVWGGDDLGMERDVTTYAAALALYHRMPNPVTFAALKTLGFVHA